MRQRRSAARVGKRGKLPRRRAITAEQFRDARVFTGLTREAAADLLGVSLRTVGHWETGKARPAYAAFKLLRVLRHGEFVDPRWSAYRVVQGKLVTPENHALEPCDMAWLSLTIRRAAAFGELLRQRDAGPPVVSASEPQPAPAPVGAGVPVASAEPGVLAWPGSRVDLPAALSGGQSAPPSLLWWSSSTPKPPHPGGGVHGVVQLGRPSAAALPPCSNTGRILTGTVPVGGGA